jgi:methanogenic corrinoid protein MtbC1
MTSSSDPLRLGLDDYLGCVSTGDQRGAIAVAMRAMADGATAAQIVEDLLAIAQEQIGRAWQDARWTVAMEHRATAITETVLDSVIVTGLRAPDAPAEGSAGRVAVLPCEGEWHTLPARMLTGVLRLRGMDVTLAGPTLPASEIPGFLGAEPPSVVGVACALPVNLAGAWRTISAVRQVGGYVVVGGRGFGEHGRWAQPVGADAWAASFSRGADLIIAAARAAPPLPRPPSGAEAAAAEVAHLERNLTLLVEAATSAALPRRERDSLSTPALATTREDLKATINVVASAVLVDDPVLVTDYAAWLESVIAARNLPLSFVTAAFAVLLDVLPDTLPRSRAMARAGQDSCTQPL